MVRPTRRFCANLFAASAMTLGPLPALAQTPRAQSTVPTPQQLNAGQSVAPQQRARNTDVFVAPEPAPCPFRDSKLSFDLKAVTFSGATGIAPARLAASFRGLVGQTIPVSAICDIRDRAASLLFSRGILARVEIPEQRIVEGQLQLEVIEARIASVRFHGDAGPAQAKVEGYLEHLRGLVPFDLNIAQRYLLLAADVPGVQISAAIRPSNQGRGAVDLDVTATRKPVAAAVNVQNFGSKTLGRAAALVRGDFDGFTPWGDHTTAVLYSTTDLREQRIGQLVEEIRPGDGGLIAHASISYARTRPGDVLAPLGLHGTSIDGQLSLNYPLIRKRNENLNLIGGVEVVNEKTTFSSGGTLIDDQLRILFGRVQAERRGSVLGLPWEGQLGLEARKGINVLGASQAGQSTLSRTEGSPDAFVQRVDGHLDLLPLPKLDLYFGFEGQYADRQLLTYEEVAIGNLTIGRGYDPSSVAGDRGAAASAEARIGPVSLFSWMQFTAYGFYDLAYVRYLDTLGERRTVHSAGGGLRATIASRFDLDVGYAHPFDKPTSTAESVPTPRVLVTVTARY